MKIGQGSTSSTTQEPVIPRYHLEFWQIIKLERPGDTRKSQGLLNGRWTYPTKLGYKEVTPGISVWSYHDWYIQCGGHFKAIALSGEVGINGTQSRDESKWKGLDHFEDGGKLQSTCAIEFGKCQFGSGALSKAGQLKGSVRPGGNRRPMAGEGDAEQEPEQAAEDEGFAARALPAPPQPHNVIAIYSHIPFRSW